MTLPATHVASANCALECRSVSKRFGSRPVLRSLNLSLDRGTRLSILGESGCGKTTLLRIIAGLEDMDGGEIVIAGSAGTGGSKDGLVNMMFQRPAVYPHMSVMENIGFPLRTRRRSKEFTKARVEELLAMLGLEHIATQRAGMLSGGEAQRVALGRAIAQPPVLLLLDEPFSNLHQSLRWKLLDDVRRMSQSNGLTSVFVTHDALEALYFGQRVAILHDGHIVQEGIPAVVSSSPSTVATARLLFRPTMNQLTVVSEEASPRGSGTHLVFPSGRVVRWDGASHVGGATLVWRPEDCTVGSVGSDGVSPDVLAFEGHVVETGYFEGRHLITVVTTEGSMRAIVGGEFAAASTAVRVTVPVVAVHQFDNDGNRIDTRRDGHERALSTA